MRHLFLDATGTKIKQEAQQILDDHGVLIAVQYAFWCSNDEIEQAIESQTNILKNIPQKVRNAIARRKNKIEDQKNHIFGRSCAGQVIAVGKKVREVVPGDLVACAADQANHTDIVCVPQHLVVKVSSRKILRHASMAALGASAMQAIRRAQLSLGETVCVVGLSIIGQLIVQLAKQAGCKVIAIDNSKERLTLAQQGGADIALHAAESDVTKEVLFATHNNGADVSIVVDMLVKVENQVRNLTRKRGKAIVVGPMRLYIEKDIAREKEIDILIAGSYGPGFGDELYEEFGIDYPYSYVRWTEQRNMQAFISFIERGAIDVEPLIGKEITVQDITSNNNITAKKACGIVFKYPITHTKSFATDLSQKDKKVSGIRFIPARKDSIRVGVVGAGSFANAKLIPLLHENNNTTMNAIVDPDGDRALQISKKYGAAKAYIFSQELFEEDVVDAVFIASPDKFHAGQVLQALRAGKAVLVENPMAVDGEQLKQISDFIEQNKDVPFCVDFNRSFAPFIRKIKKAIGTRSTPMMTQYRINAPLLHSNHWIHSESGAGRIIGQAAHIIDLFCYLIDAEPLAVSVESVTLSGDQIFPTDNYSIQLRFSDGSIATLLYTSLGHVDTCTERMEVFFDGKTIVLDDYVRLEGYGLPASFGEVATYPDKGHGQMVKSFLRALQQDMFVSPINFQRLQQVTELTLLIDKLACEGGGNQNL